MKFSILRIPFVFSGFFFFPSESFYTRWHKNIINFSQYSLSHPNEKWSQHRWNLKTYWIRKKYKFSFCLLWRQSPKKSFPLCGEHWTRRLSIMYHHHHKQNGTFYLSEQKKNENCVYVRCKNYMSSLSFIELIFP